MTSAEHGVHASGAYPAPLRCVCGILHGSDVTNPTDDQGCLLADDHAGPHEFMDPSGRSWLWETDMECDCEHCQRCEGDYCTVYWRKPENNQGKKSAHG